jgi:LysR family glycine cleavage system transcriptional activator
LGYASLMAEALPSFASLYAFVLVAETGSMTAAAERLNITQPAISKRLRALEAELGVALLRRGANAMQLTEAGRQFASSLAAGFSTIKQATQALPNMPRRPLKIRTHNTWAARWLIPRLGRFRARHPDYEVAVTTSLNPVDFARDGIDLAIISADRRPAPNAERLQPVHIAPYVAPSLASRVRQFGFDGLTLLGSHARPHDWALWFERNDLSITAAPVLFESTMLAVQAALEGLGVVIVSPNLVKDDVQQKRLSAIASTMVKTSSYFWLLLPVGTPRREAADFRIWLIEEVSHDDQMICPG